MSSKTINLNDFYSMDKDRVAAQSYGSDPEFAFYSEDDKAILWASGYVEKTWKGQIGVDHHGQIGELRPLPGKTLKEVMERIFPLMHKLDELRQYKIPEVYAMHSGGGEEIGHSLGGHIHFGWPYPTLPTRKSIEEVLIPMLDTYIGIPLKSAIGGTRSIYTKKGHFSSYLSSFGRLSSYEFREYSSESGFGSVDNGQSSEQSTPRKGKCCGIEYRTPPSMLKYPLLYKAVMETAIAINSFIVANKGLITLPETPSREDYLTLGVGPDSATVMATLKESVISGPINLRFWRRGALTLSSYLQDMESELRRRENKCEYSFLPEVTTVRLKLLKSYVEKNLWFSCDFQELSKGAFAADGIMSIFSELVEHKLLAKEDDGICCRGKLSISNDVFKKDNEFTLTSAFLEKYFSYPDLNTTFEGKVYEAHPTVQYSPGEEEEAWIAGFNEEDENFFDLKITLPIHICTSGKATAFINKVLANIVTRIKNKDSSKISQLLKTIEAVNTGQQLESGEDTYRHAHSDDIERRIRESISEMLGISPEEEPEEEASDEEGCIEPSGIISAGYTPIEYSPPRDFGDRVTSRPFPTIRPPSPTIRPFPISSSPFNEDEGALYSPDSLTTGRCLQQVNPPLESLESAGSPLEVVWPLDNDNYYETTALLFDPALLFEMEKEHPTGLPSVALLDWELYKNDYGITEPVRRLFMLDIVNNADYICKLRLNIDEIMRALHGISNYITQKYLDEKDIQSTMRDHILRTNKDIIALLNKTKNKKREAHNSNSNSTAEMAGVYYQTTQQPSVVSVSRTLNFTIHPDTQYVERVLVREEELEGIQQTPQPIDEGFLPTALELELGSGSSAEVEANTYEESWINTTPPDNIDAILDVM